MHDKFIVLLSVCDKAGEPVEKNVLLECMSEWIIYKHIWGADQILLFSVVSEIHHFWLGYCSFTVIVSVLYSFLL